jgi:uncharacterized protein (DUF488 family)
MEIYTIGFTKKDAKTFFGTLIGADATRLVDVRIHNASQLAGFTKQNDLRYFLSELAHMDYAHERALAPTAELLEEYRKHRIPWSEYEGRFMDLMAERRIEETVPQDLFSGRPVLLCSEATPQHCHRRLVAEYLNSHWGDIEIVHL